MKVSKKQGLAGVFIIGLIEVLTFTQTRQDENSQILSHMVDLSVRLKK